MADASTSLKGLREQMVAAAQAIAEERRSHSGNSPIPSAGNAKGGTKPVIDGSTLRTDDRQRLARERREEREKQNAAKESQMIEKEKKAKLQYERQMEERQRKMEEQKLKEEQRRAAVEEKRKLKTEEEKERNEAVLRRTLERSQRMEQRQKRWSWGGTVPSDSDGHTGAKRSTSSCSLKQAETVLSKRLSSSSATLPNSADKSVKTRSSSLSRLSNKAVPHSQQPPPPIKGSQTEMKGGADSKRSSSLNRLANVPQSPSQLEKEKVKNEDKSSARRSQTSPLDSNILSRLLAPTQASLARSKNAAALSADGKDPPASTTTTNTPVHTPKGPMRSRSIDRQSPAPSTTTSSAEARSPESTQKPEIGRQSPSIIKKRPPSPSNTANRRRSPSPANLANRPPSPSTLKSQNQKIRPPSPSLLKKRPYSAPSKPSPITRPSLTPSVSSITKKKSDVENKPKDKTEEPITPELLSPTSEKDISVGASKAQEDLSGKITSGTITAEEAAKTLAEKRRLAREQRERDEQEKLQRAEEERIQKEERDRKAAEEKVRIEEERKKLEEKRRAEEEEAFKLADEEKIRSDLEELRRVAELQQQKEEADAKALEEAEKQKLEREKIMQQNMQERLERKKRIEEIMKRTRKNDLSDDKCEEKSDDQDPEELEDEEEFLQLEYPNQQGERNSIDLSQEITRINESNSEKSSLLASTDPVVQDVVEPELIFVNGDEQSCDKENEESPFENVKSKDSSASKESVQNSEVLQVNKDETIDSLQNMNGKPSSWTFEEFIDLGINSKPTKLASESRTASTCNQNMIDNAFIPTTPKVAFEEVGAVDILTKSIEAASEI